MRQTAIHVAVVVALLGLMIGVGELRVGGGPPLTLAAIGFVVLAAFTLAELGARLTLPKVTGYILAGVALGPYATNILSDDVVRDMKMFNELALGLIATSAGLELDAKAIGRMWRSLTATVALKILLLPLAVGGTFYGLQTAFGLLPIEGDALVIGGAAVFSALAIGTSPAIALAVLSETKAKGRLSELTLGLAVLKDAVVVICLAVAVAVALSLSDPAASLSLGVFVDVAEHLGEEVLVGIVLAGLLVVYMRFVGAEMLLFVAAMVLVVTNVTSVLHLQPLLVFIVAGFIIRNFTKYEHTLLHPLEVVALPVFVVFFTNAGASVDLQTTWRILPFALALCAVRAVAFYVAGRFGAAAGKLPVGVQKVAWLAYLPQAGVTLGLVGIAALQLPLLSEVIVSTGMAVVAVNLLVGPITLRVALRRAGELPTAAPAPAPTDAVATSVASGPVPVAPIPPRPALADATLQRFVDRIADDLDARIDAFVTERLDPWSQELDEEIARCLPLDSGEGPARQERALGRLLEWAQQEEETPAYERASALLALYEHLREDLMALPAEVAVERTAADRATAPEDDFGTRRRKLVATLARMIGLGRKRVVPVRMAARSTLEPRLAPAMRDALSMWLRTEAAVFAELRHLAEGNRGAAEVRGTLSGLMARWAEQLRADIGRAVAEGLVELGAALERAGGPRLPSRRLRYSRVEPGVTRALGELERAGRQWELPLVAARRTLDLVIRLELLQRRTVDLLTSKFLEPLDELFEGVVPHAVATRDRLRALRGQLDADRGAPPYELLAAGSRKAFSQEAHRDIKKRRAQFRDVVSEVELTRGLRELVEALPVELTVLAQGTPLQYAKSPSEVKTHTVALRRVSEEALLVELQPVIDEHVREAHATANAVNSQLRDHVGVAAFALDAAAKATADEAPRALAADGLDRATRRVAELVEVLDRTRDDTPTVVLEGLSKALAAVRAAAARATVDVVEGRSRWDSTRRTLARAAEAMATRAAGIRHWLRSQYARLRRSEIGAELQRRAGLGRVDANTLRELLLDDVRSPGQPALPPMYARLFTVDPLLDRRFFAARRGELRTLLRDEQAAAEADGGGDGVLVVGDHGSGRSSLLNVAQNELRAPRVLRLGDEHERRHGLLAALAAELQTDPTTGDVRSALAQEPTSIVIDDFESWFSPTPTGVQSLERALELIVTTRANAFWIVAISEDALAVLDPLVALRQAFGRVLTLEPLDPEALSSVIEARNRISGLKIEYPRARLGGVFGRRGVVASRAAYYRNLARTSGGNLRAAVRAWHHDVTPMGEDAVAPVLRSHVLRNQRVLDQLHPHALAILVHALRFARLDVEVLSRALALPPGELGRHLTFLRTAGILVRRTGLRGGLRIDPNVQPTIAEALRDLGALRRTA